MSTTKPYTPSIVITEVYVLEIVSIYVIFHLSTTLQMHQNVGELYNSLKYFSKISINLLLTYFFKHCNLSELMHWGLNKMADILQTTF